MKEKIFFLKIQNMWQYRLDKFKFYYIIITITKTEEFYGTTAFYTSRKKGRKTK